MSAANNRFLVMGMTGLVLRDLIGAMKDRFPALQATTAVGEADAIAHVTEKTGWKYAFLNLGPDAFIASELASVFEALETKIILLGTAAEDAEVSCPYPILARPFREDDIFRLLEEKR